MNRPIGERESLEEIDLLIGLHVWQGLQASIITRATSHLFHMAPHGFWTNPANTLLYAAFRALEDQAIVHVAEVLVDEMKLRPVQDAVRRKADLVCHRNAIRHPVTIKWRKAEMQQFFEQDRQWTDLRAALVWDMQLSINDRLRELGGSPRTTTIKVNHAMSIAVRDILRLSIKPEGQAEIPSETDLLTVLESFRNHYLDFLVKNPDGGRAGRG